MTRRRLACFKSHKAMIDNHNEPESLPEISKTFTIMKYLDQIPTHLHAMLGVASVPLAYVIRQDADAPDPLPALIPDKLWSTGKTIVIEELIDHFQHEGPVYDADNAQVFNLLATALGGTTAMASITRYQRTRNGRQAYLDLVTHNMGSAKWEKTVETAKNVLLSRVWNGKNSRYPLKIHIAHHREAHNYLVRVSHQVAYIASNETSRVRYLLASIQTSDPTICSAKTTIQADAAKKDDFEAAADFIITVAPNPKPPQGRNQRISALKTTSKNKHRKIRTGPKTGVEVWFYWRHEWSKLSKEEQDEVREISQEELKQQGTKQKTTDDGKIAALKSKLEEQANKIAVLSSAKSDIKLPPTPKGNPLKPSPGPERRMTRTTQDDHF